VNAPHFVSLAASLGDPLPERGERVVPAGTSTPPAVVVGAARTTSGARTLLTAWLDKQEATA
jgi:hypothetical protein